jgi:hypothetical protein
MPSRQEQKLLSGAEQFLEPGERAVAAITAQAKGVSQARGTAAGVGGVVGAAASTLAKPGQEHEAAAAAGLEIASPMALVLTDRRLMTLKTGTSIGLGMGGGVKGLMSAVPLAEVESIETKRVGLAKRVELTVRGVVFNLECNVGASTDELATSFRELKGAGAGD